MANQTDGTSMLMRNSSGRVDNIEAGARQTPKSTLSFVFLTTLTILYYFSHVMDCTI